MRICVIDGRGGGLGRRLIECLLAVVDERHEVVVLGTNQTAADITVKAGARHVVIGEWAILRSVRLADVILGSLSVVLAGSWGGHAGHGGSHSRKAGPETSASSQPTWH